MTKIELEKVISELKTKKEELDNSIRAVEEQIKLCDYSPSEKALATWGFRKEDIGGGNWYSCDAPWDPPFQNLRDIDYDLDKQEVELGGYVVECPEEVNIRVPYKLLLIITTLMTEKLIKKNQEEEK